MKRKEYMYGKEKLENQRDAVLGMVHYINWINATLLAFKPLKPER